MAMMRPIYCSALLCHKLWPLVYLIFDVYKMQPKLVENEEIGCKEGVVESFSPLWFNVFGRYGLKVSS